jgi:hypothetical protein
MSGWRTETSGWRTETIRVPWTPGATDIVVLGVPTRVAALEDVVRSKEAAGRDKDRVMLPVLRALVRRIREREG